MNLISNLLFLIVGFYIGRQWYIHDIKEVKKQAAKIQRVVHHTVSNVVKGPSGVVIRPSVNRLNEIKRDKIKTDGVRALEETFDEIPELKEARKLSEKYGKSTNR